MLAKKYSLLYNTISNRKQKTALSQPKILGESKMDQKIQKMKDKTKNWYKQNLANFISFIKIVASFLFFYELLYGKNILGTIIYGSIAALADLIDGPAARWLKIESVFGSYLDRIGDRIFIYPTLVILGWQHKNEIIFPGLFFALICSLAFFEILLSRVGITGLLWHAKGLKVNLEPNKAGKKKIFTGFILVFIWIASLWLKSIGLPVLKYSIYLIYLGLVLMVYWACISWRQYTARSEEIKKNKESSE